MNGEPVGRHTREQVAFSPEREWLYPFFTVQQSLELAVQLYTDFQMAEALTRRRKEELAAFEGTRVFELEASGLFIGTMHNEYAMTGKGESDA
ncbi:hypothetical protein [Brevibacillus daliensis]|uniref:hypothetical protein n=1 Tax=Brevibacillus daliensis TaxID=2892995 RepID=UPI001E5DF2B2|nr:hypothetical protein [Brevibacillus daliensis]